MLLAQESIQEAIRLHEACEYRRSTAMFGRLADPAGPNNPLSQVLYGLALRHGWGIEENPAEAMRYLQAAAKNSAAVEDEALRAGMKKGGTAKGELVLALYEVRYLPPCGGTARSLSLPSPAPFPFGRVESSSRPQLGNSFRHGWGVDKDLVAAREYYETAANLGDSDAQNEVGRCYEEGFGCKKDKVPTPQCKGHAARTNHTTKTTEEGGKVLPHGGGTRKQDTGKLMVSCCLPT